jgi:hypothetical protein
MKHCCQILSPALNSKIANVARNFVVVEPCWHINLTTGNTYLSANAVSRRAVLTPLLASAVSKWTLLSTDIRDHSPITVAWPGGVVAFPHDLASRPGFISADNTFHSDKCLPDPTISVVYMNIFRKFKTLK